MKTFVMGDIHGMYKAFQQCLERSGFNEEEDTLIQLGDVVDRGPQTFEVVERLLSLKHLISIRGNHDEWFYEWLKTGKHPGMSQGGAASVKSYKNHCAPKTEPDYWNQVNLDVPADHVGFFHNQLPWYMDKDLNIFVHGGFNRHHFLVDQPDKYVFWWDRDLWHTALSYGAMQKGLVYNEPGGNIGTFKIKEPCKEIFIGHTPTLMWKKDIPMKAANVNNLDTGAGMGGKLTIMDLETREFWQSDCVEELYPPRRNVEV